MPDLKKKKKTYLELLKFTFGLCSVRNIGAPIQLGIFKGKEGVITTQPTPPPIYFLFFNFQGQYFPNPLTHGHFFFKGASATKSWEKSIIFRYELPV